jgi:AcrR family transcriptional regulator
VEIMARSGRAARMPAAERRAAIVAATLPLVLAHGAGVSTRQIAEAAGVAEGTIFRVFADKDELMCSVIAEAFDPQPTLRQLAEVDRTLPLRPRLVAATEILKQRLSGAFALIDALGLTGPPPRADERAKPAGPALMNDAFRAAVADLIGPDRVRLRVPAEEFAHLLRLLVFAGTHPKISDGRPLSAADVVATLLDGLGLPGGGIQAGNDIDIDVGTEIDVGADVDLAPATHRART